MDVLQRDRCRSATHTYRYPPSLWGGAWMYVVYVGVSADCPYGSILCVTKLDEWMLVCRLYVPYLLGKAYLGMYLLGRLEHLSDCVRPTWVGSSKVDAERLC